MWAFANLQNTIWVNPQFNPEGNYDLCADTIKILGINDAERYLGKKPNISNVDSSKELEEEWSRFMSGEDFDPPEGEDTHKHLVGHLKQKEEKYYDLDPEYRAVFDKHIFKTMANFRKLVNEMQKQQMVNAMMMSMMPESMAGKPLQPMQGQPTQQGQQSTSSQGGNVGMGGGNMGGV